LKEWPELVGRTFEEITFMMPDAVPLGFKRYDRRKHAPPDSPNNSPPESPSSGYSGESCRRSKTSSLDWVHTKQGRFMKYGIELNPGKGAVMEPGDELLVLATDDDTCATSPHSSNSFFVLCSSLYFLIEVRARILLLPCSHSLA